MAKKRIDVEIGVKNKIAAGLKSVKAALKRFGQTAGSIMKGVAVASVAVGTAIVALGVKAVKAFAVQEMAEKSLIEAMVAHGDAVDQLLPKYKELASRIQDETGIADESTLATIAKLRTIGVANDKMDTAIKLTLALGKAGMREKTALRAAADAMNGNTTQLTTYIPELRNAKTEAEKLAIVNDLMARGYKQLTGELDTNTGRWNELKGRIGDVLEKIGGAVSGGSTLKDTIAALAGRIKSFGESPRFDAFLEKVKSASEMVMGFFKVIAGGGGVARAAIVSLGDVIQLSLISGAQQAANLMYSGLQAAWGMFHDKAMNGFATYAKMLGSPKFAAQKLGEWMGKGSAGAEQGVKTLFDTEGTSQRRNDAIDRLGELIKGINIEAKMPSTTTVGGATPGASVIKTGIGVTGPQGGGISESTSMLSAGDLFTMMQTGSDSKATMVSEQQKTNEKLDELIRISGGVE